MKAAQRTISTSGMTIVHPHPAVRIGAPAAYFGMVWLFASSASGDDLSEVAGLALFAMIALLVLATAIRQRVTISDDEVQVLRLVSRDRIPRADIDHVARSHGRGRPAHLALVPDVFFEGRGVVVGSWPLVQTRRATAISLPSLMTARRVARALDVPETSFDGGPVTGESIEDALASLRTEDGRIRPYAWALGSVLLVLGGFVIALAVLGPVP